MQMVGALDGEDADLQRVVGIRCRPGDAGVLLARGGEQRQGKRGENKNQFAHESGLRTT